MNKRNWQEICYSAWLRENKKNFLIEACPAAGKTKMALCIAEHLKKRRIIEQIIVVTPTRAIKEEWGVVAENDYGFKLDTSFKTVPPDYDGLVTTYQAVIASPEWYRAIANKKPTMLILDEIHHCGKDLSWTKALEMAFGDEILNLKNEYYYLAHHSELIIYRYRGLDMNLNTMGIL